MAKLSNLSAADLTAIKAQIQATLDAQGENQVHTIELKSSIISAVTYFGVPKAKPFTTERNGIKTTKVMMALTEPIFHKDVTAHNKIFYTSYCNNDRAVKIPDGMTFEEGETYIVSGNLFATLKGELVDLNTKDANISVSLRIDKKLEVTSSTPVLKLTAAGTTMGKTIAELLTNMTSDQLIATGLATY